MPPKADNVQRLLQAEEKRNKAVAEAKQEKLQRVRQARADAEKDVSDFRQQKETELQQYGQQQGMTSASERSAVERETDAEIQAVQRTANSRMEKVSSLMVEMICSVQA